MASEWFYQAFGQEFGPITSQELIQLAATGQIDGQSSVRPSGSAAWRRASSVPELGFQQPQSPPKANAADDWYILVAGTVRGPVTFERLIRLAEARKIGAEDQVKFGACGKWRRAGSIGRLMSVMPFQSAEQASSLRIDAPSQITAPLASPTPQPVSAPPIESKAAPVRQAAENQTSPRSDLPQESSPAVVTSVEPSPLRRPTPVEVPAVSPATFITQPFNSPSSRTAPMPMTASRSYARPPVRRPSQSSGPGLISSIKEAITGEYRNHAIGLAVTTMFLTYWFIPRGPVRPVAVHPVKGSVVIDGQPLANAAIVLHHVNGPAKDKKMPPNIAPHGKAAADGTFALETFDPADGAPEGEFVATVFLVEESVVDGEKTFGPNVLPTQYSRPETSPFKVRITSATRELEPLKLTRQ